MMWLTPSRSNPSKLPDMATTPAGYNAAGAHGCRPKGRRTVAFTLIELLVVMSIIVIMMSIAIPAFTQINRSSSLTTAGGLLMDQLSAARQVALAQNKVVELRFYELGRDSNRGKQDGGDLGYRAVQILVLDHMERVNSPDGPSTEAPGYTAYGNLVRLPAGIVFSKDPAFSTVIHPGQNVRNGAGTAVPNPTYSEEAKSPLSGTLPGEGGQQFKYQVFRFRPSGGTDLNPNGPPKSFDQDDKQDQWSITVKNEFDPVVGSPGAAGSRPANNYVTATINTFSGKARVYRP